MVVHHVVNAVLNSVGDETDVKPWGILQGSVNCASSNQHDWKQNKCKFKNSTPLIAQQSTLRAQWDLCGKQLISHRKGSCLSLLGNMLAIHFTSLPCLFCPCLNSTFIQFVSFTFMSSADTTTTSKAIHPLILVEEYEVQATTKMYCMWCRWYIKAKNI